MQGQGSQGQRWTKQGNALKSAHAAIQYCGWFTGLQLNIKKTTVFSPHLDKELTVAGMKVSSGPVKYLETWLGLDTAELNFSSVLTKMKVKIRCWQSRPLSLKARVLVFFSICTHVLNTTFVSNKHLDSLQCIANEFLWRGRNKVSQNTCCNQPGWGGLNHLHVKHFVHSFYSKWMIWLWLDKGETWSCIAWQQLIKHIPVETIPGIHQCSESILTNLKPFYAAII